MNWRSKKYRDYLAELPCHFTSKKAVPHHIKCLGGGGGALKPPDSHCLPINQVEVHLPIHQYGEIGIFRQFIPGAIEHELSDEQIKGVLAIICLGYLSDYLAQCRGKP